ncbi:site-specific integrase [Azospirillum canadense]|uniref:hypothetical protein n=1 Tax=Azospirillum canadense TaxID=403962 RepID=UPI002227EACA|nr:hypothetical protein [Azospirillum canadense]MCW2241498.1 hypothetical protein [Azospirillum canadense]
MRWHLRTQRREIGGAHGAGHRPAATAVPVVDRAGLLPLSPTSVARVVRAVQDKTRRYSLHLTGVGVAQRLVAAGFDLPAIQQASG